MRPRILGRQTGVTLLEMVMLLAIIALTGLIIAPNLVSFVTVWDLDTEVSRVRAKVWETQQLAINKQMVHRIRWDTANDSVYIYDFMDNLLEIVPLKNDIQIDSTSFALISPGNIVEFDIFGAPNEGGTITFVDPKGKTARINIEAVTGKLFIT